MTMSGPPASSSFNDGGSSRIDHQQPQPHWQPPPQWQQHYMRLQQQLLILQTKNEEQAKEIDRLNALLQVQAHAEAMGEQSLESKRLFIEREKNLYAHVEAMGEQRLEHHRLSNERQKNDNATSLGHYQLFNEDNKDARSAANQSQKLANDDNKDARKASVAHRGLANAAAKTALLSKAVVDPSTIEGGDALEQQRNLFVHQAIDNQPEEAGQTARKMISAGVETAKLRAQGLAVKSCGCGLVLAGSHQGVAPARATVEDLMTIVVTNPETGENATISIRVSHEQTLLKEVYQNPKLDIAKVREWDGSLNDLINGSKEVVLKLLGQERNIIASWNKQKMEITTTLDLYKATPTDAAILELVAVTTAEKPPGRF